MSCEKSLRRFCSNYRGVVSFVSACVCHLPNPTTQSKHWQKSPKISKKYLLSKSQYYFAILGECWAGVATQPAAHGEMLQDQRAGQRSDAPGTAGTQCKSSSVSSSHVSRVSQSRGILSQICRKYTSWHGFYMCPKFQVINDIICDNHNFEPVPGKKLVRRKQIPFPVGAEIVICDGHVS